MQIISRGVTQGIVFEGQARVTVVEIVGDYVTLEITGPDGESQRVTLESPQAADQTETVEDESLVTC